MRSRAGGDAGFDLEDASLVDLKEAVRRLRLAADVLEEYQDEPTSRFVENAKWVMRPALKWDADVEHHQRRRTMPITNASGHTHEVSRSINVIGYRHPYVTPTQIPEQLASYRYSLCSV